MSPSPNGPPSTYVQGYGCVEDQYNSYGHTYSVDVLLNSPDGRSSEGYADGNSYARGDVSIEFDGITGLYYTSHSTMVSCPISNTSFSGGGSESSRTIGISFSAFYKAADISPERAVYQLVSPCNVTCVYHPSGAFYRLAPPPSPNYIRIGEPFFQLYGYRICEGLVDSYQESVSPLACYEIAV
jgi:hypothetical protein